MDREYRLDDYTDASVPHLVLMLDSIPFETMAQRYAAGDFRWFDPPRKMIAPFPSLTEVCFSDVLRAPPLPGFIDQYFDPRDQQRKDILWERVKGLEQPWERRLDYGANYLEQGLAFLHPDEWYEAELERARLAVERSPDRVTVVYIASAACMVCKFGKAGAERVLDGARRLCLQLLYERRGAIKISMMADHGHNYMPSTNVFLDKMLLNSGIPSGGSIEAGSGLHHRDQCAGDVRGNRYVSSGCGRERAVHEGVGGGDGDLCRRGAGDDSDRAGNSGDRVAAG